MERELNEDSGPTTFTIRVSHGHDQHEVSVPSNSTFGDLKSVIVKTIGLEPETYKLLFRGKEKEDDEDLQTAGVKDNSKVVLMEDMTCRQTSPEEVKEEVKETSVISRGDEAVAAVREELDMLSEQVSALQAVVDSGTQVDAKDIIYLTEILMRQLLKLDAIEAEGEGRLQRKMEVRRVQSFVDTMDALKSRNSNLYGDSNNDVSATTQQETFEPGCESVDTASPSCVPIDMASSTTTPSAAASPVSSSLPSPVPSSTKFVNLERDFPGNNIGSVNETLIKHYWEQICQIILKTPLDELSTVKPMIYYLVMEMKNHMRDTTSLEGQLRSFFESASIYVEVKLESIQRGTQEVHEKSLSFAQRDLSEVEALESERVNVVSGLKAELLENARQQGELRARLAELINEEEVLNLSLHEAKEGLSSIQKSVANKREHFSELVNTPYLSKQEVDALKKMEILLEESRRDLVAFDLFA